MELEMTAYIAYIGLHGMYQHLADGDFAYIRTTAAYNKGTRKGLLPTYNIIL